VEDGSGPPRAGPALISAIANPEEVPEAAGVST
jgi:hypothetical protein